MGKGRMWGGREKRKCNGLEKEGIWCPNTVFEEAALCLSLDQVVRKFLGLGETLEFTPKQGTEMAPEGYKQ